MSLGTYDSPTFLGKKDVYLLGLTMPQIAISLGTLACWFLVALMFNLTMQQRLIYFGPCFIVTLLLLFVRMSGLMLPTFLILFVKYILVKPRYESSPEMLLDGPVEMSAVNADQVGPKALLRKLKPFGRKIKDDDGLVARRSEVQAEASRQSDEMMRNANSGVKDLVKSLWKS